MLGQKKFTHYFFNVTKNRYERLLVVESTGLHTLMILALSQLYQDTSLAFLHGNGKSQISRDEASALNRQGKFHSYKGSTPQFLEAFRVQNIASQLVSALRQIEGMCNMPEVKQAMMKHEQSYYHKVMRVVREALSRVGD